MARVFFIRSFAWTCPPPLLALPCATIAYGAVPTASELAPPRELHHIAKASGAGWRIQAAPAPPTNDPASARPSMIYRRGSALVLRGPPPAAPPPATSTPVQALAAEPEETKEAAPDYAAAALAVEDLA